MKATFKQNQPAWRWTFVCPTSQFIDSFEFTDAKYVILSKNLELVQGFVSFKSAHRQSWLMKLNPDIDWTVATQSTGECIEKIKELGEFVEIGNKPRIVCKEAYERLYGECRTPVKTDTCIELN